MKVFVGNRVSDVLELSDRKQWKHIKGTDNPADVVSRGVLDPRKLMEGDWFRGPAFLYTDEDTWTVMEVGELSEEDKEIRQKSIYVSLISAINTINSETIDMKRFSDWTRVKRVAGWVVRFAQNILRRKEDWILDNDLDLEELKTAETMLVKDAQQSSFSSEVETLVAGGDLPDSNKLSSLSPFVDEEGVLRVGGRLRYIPIPSEAQHPVILPRCHEITRLIIEWLHKKNGHVGREHVLSLLLEKYWVMSARVAIKTAIRLCFFCQVRKAKRLLPKMADLPIGRAAVDEPAFSQCGVYLKS